MTYDYDASKKRIEEILDAKIEIIQKDKLPNELNVPFNNGYITWISSLFVDIRGFTRMCKKEDSITISKILRSFTSETIEILKDNKNLQEIGIRGDCVYAIYTTYYSDNVYDVVLKAIEINTFIELLNKLLYERSYPIIKVGIGISTDEDVVIEARKKHFGDNHFGTNMKVWIGEAVTKASKFSNIGNKRGNKTIILSDSTYKMFINEVRNRGLDIECYFEKRRKNRELYYMTDIKCDMIR